MPRRVDRDSARSIIVFKLKLRFELFAEFHRGGEGPAHLAAKSFQRPDLAFGEQPFHFTGFE
jgi:hypothetical protein